MEQSPGLSYNALHRERGGVMVHRKTKTEREGKNEMKSEEWRRRQEEM